MTARHITCGAPVVMKTVIADDGDLALVRFCSTCDMALGDDEVDAPMSTADTTAAELADFVRIATQPSRMAQ